MKVSPDDRVDARQDIGPGSVDDLFRRAAARTPDAWALIDPPDRAHFTDAAPRRLTYAGADRAIEALAGRLLDLGLAAAGNAIVAEAALTPGGAILGALATSSFAGLGSLVMPWLITGGRLALHQPFSPEAFLAQLNDEHCETAVVPAAILAPMQEAGLLGGASALRAVLAVWRSPEFLSAAAAWPNAARACVDVAAFGEAGIIARRRGSDGRPAGIPLALGSEAAIEVARTATGTLAIRGPMVPAGPAAGIEPGDPLALKIDAEGFIDTEYPCRLDLESNTLIVNGPPAGLINVGGYRFAWRELQDLLAELGEGGSLAALPDRLAGHRLAGVAADPERVRNALATRGVNPLVVAAFRDRR